MCSHEKKNSCATQHNPIPKMFPLNNLVIVKEQLVVFVSITFTYFYQLLQLTLLCWCLLVHTVLMVQDLKATTHLLVFPLLYQAVTGLDWVVSASGLCCSAVVMAF